MCFQQKFNFVVCILMSTVLMYLEIINLIATLLFVYFFIRDPSGSFIPFSVSLGNMLRELHRSLALALAAENAVLALTQLLRVVAVLVQNTPYHRLQAGLLTKIVRSVRPLTVHKGIVAS